MEYNELVYNTERNYGISLRIKLVRKAVITTKDIAEVIKLSKLDSEGDYLIAGKIVENNQNVLITITDGCLFNCINGIPNTDEQQLQVYFKKLVALNEKNFKNIYSYDEFNELCNSIKLDSTKKIDKWITNILNKHNFKKLNLATKMLFTTIKFEPVKSI